MSPSLNFEMLRISNRYIFCGLIFYNIVSVDTTRGCNGNSARVIIYIHNMFIIINQVILSLLHSVECNKPNKYLSTAGVSYNQ